MVSPSFKGKSPVSHQPLKQCLHNIDLCNNPKRLECNLQDYRKGVGSAVPTILVSVLTLL